jgi:hypothetical protein
LNATSMAPTTAAGRFSASATSGVLAASYSSHACGSAGIALHSDPKLVRVSSKKTMPRGSESHGRVESLPAKHPPRHRTKEVQR